MRMISIFIMRMKMMESMLNMLLLLAIFLAIRRRSSKFRKTPNASTCQSSKKQVTGKKRVKNDDVLSDLVGEIHEYVAAFKEANDEIKGISTYFKKQTKSNDRKMRIFDEIMELPGFSRQEIMDAGEYILKDAHKVDSFFALPKAFRRDYVVKQLFDAILYRPSIDFQDGNDI